MFGGVEYVIGNIIKRFKLFFNKTLEFTVVRLVLYIMNEFVELCFDLLEFWWDYLAHEEIMVLM